MAERTNIKSLCGSFVETFKRFNDNGGHARPFVLLTFSQSIDGCIAQQTGGRRHEISDASIELRHQLRAMNDAVLVGRGTIASDDPILNVRLNEGPSPQPVILDSHLRTSLDARVINEGSVKPWFVFSDIMNPEISSGLIEKGCDLIRVPAQGTGLSLSETLEQLYSRGVKSLVVEGGASVIHSFLSQGLADYVVITISNQFISEPDAQKYDIQSHGRAPKVDDMKSFASGEGLITYGPMRFEPEVAPLPFPQQSSPDLIV